MFERNTGTRRGGRTVPAIGDGTLRGVAAALLAAFVLVGSGAPGAVAHDRPVMISRIVADLERTREFWEELGYEIHDFEEGEDGAGLQVAMPLSESGLVLFQTPAYIERLGFEPPPVAESGQMGGGTSVVLVMDERDWVDALHAEAVSHGGTNVGAPFQIEGIDSYGRSFADPDGYVWTLYWQPDFW